MQTTTISLGQFELFSSILKIVDPFIKNSNQEQKDSIVTNVQEGKWHAQLTMIENLGNANITMFHESFSANNNNIVFNTEDYVESNGYLACVDYNAYPMLQSVENFNEQLSVEMEELEATIIDMGVVSKTGMNAGSYQVQTITEEDKVIALRLVFIETENEETPTQEELEDIIE